MLLDLLWGRERRGESLDEPREVLCGDEHHAAAYVEAEGVLVARLDGVVREVERVCRVL